VAQDCAKSLAPISPDGVCTFCEVSVEIAALTAELLSLPHPPPDLVKLCRDKHAVREKLNLEGIDIIRHFRIPYEANEIVLKAAADAVKFPAVFKPVSGADSIGVKRVDSFRDLKAAFENGKQIVSHSSFASA
jgi:carnosine synthase